MSGTLVAGAGVAGTAAALALLRRGATVTVVDRASTPALVRLAAAGARVVVADEPPADLLDGVSDVVVSPGFAPHHPLAARAVAAGLDVYSEPELAWRLRGPDAPAWLAVTGTNGKTTTVTMLASILRAAGLRSAALGNIGEPLVEATGYDVIAVELSSFQLHWSRTLAPQAGALLNLADDHLDWHGDFAAYAGAKTAIWRAATPEGGGTAVGNLDDPRVAALLGAVPGRAVGFTLGPPAPGQLGVRDGMLVDATGAALIEAGMVRPPEALARHAPSVPVIDIASTDDGAMGQVVRAAAALASPGDTVLLAPAAASLDMFESYARRGDAFAAAVRELPGASRD